jgi:hypothetical protein
VIAFQAADNLKQRETLLDFQCLPQGGTDKGRDQSSISDRKHRRKLMKKSWKKPTMCTVSVGLEMSRYRSAELKPKK